MKMKELMLCGHPVRVDDQGLLCLTDIWIASGRDEKNKPSNFLRNDKTQEYISYLEKSLYRAFYTVKGRNGGTYAHRKVCYEFAGWVRPEYKDFVYDVLDAYYSGDLKTERQWKMQAELQQFAIDDGVSKRVGTMGSHLMLRRKREKHHLENRAIVLLKKYPESWVFMTAVSCWVPLLALKGVSWTRGYGASRPIYRWYAHAG